MSDLVYAYADESILPGRYLMSVVVVEADAAGALRRRTRSLLLSGQRRLQFQKESARRRKELVGELVTFDLTVAVFSCRLQRGQSEPRARAACCPSSSRARRVLRRPSRIDGSTSRCSKAEHPTHAPDDLAPEDGDGPNTRPGCRVCALRTRRWVRQMVEVPPAADRLRSYCRKSA